MGTGRFVLRRAYSGWMHADVDIKPASVSDLVAVGGLRWDSLEENGGQPDDTRESFAARFAAWAAGHDSTHTCFVAVTTADREVVGMAWLAVTLRVPSARAFDRASGDLQCAYVVPRLRDAGIGARLVLAVLERASALGLERVTVHSSPGAVRFYERAGFASEDVLLHATVTSQPHA